MTQEIKKLPVIFLGLFFITSFLYHSWIELVLAPSRYSFRRSGRHRTFS